MKIIVSYPGGVQEKKIVAELPTEGAIFEGFIVSEAELYPKAYGDGTVGRIGLSTPDEDVSG